MGAQGERRRESPGTAAGPRRRWSDDPELLAAFERVMLVIGKALVAFRIRAGWSIDTTARAAGLDPETVLRLEKGKTDPQLSTLVRVFFVLGMRVVVGFRPSVPETARFNSGDFPTHHGNLTR